VLLVCFWCYWLLGGFVCFVVLGVLVFSLCCCCVVFGVLWLVFWVVCFVLWFVLCVFCVGLVLWFVGFFVVLCWVGGL
jgi:hypothetical protein